MALIMAPKSSLVRITFDMLVNWYVWTRLETICRIAADGIELIPIHGSAVQNFRQKQALIPLTWPASSVGLVLLIDFVKFIIRVSRRVKRRNKNDEICSSHNVVMA